MVMQVYSDQKTPRTWRSSEALNPLFRTGVATVAEIEDARLFVETSARKFGVSL
jgi:hypothetical protein